MPSFLNDFQQRVQLNLKGSRETAQGRLNIYEQIAQDIIKDEIQDDFPHIQNPVTKQYFQFLRAEDIKGRANKGDNYREIVPILMSLSINYGIDFDDPLFIILLELGVLKTYLHDVPGSLSYGVERVHRELNDHADKLKSTLGGQWDQFLSEGYNLRVKEYEQQLQVLATERENEIFKNVSTQVIETLQQLESKDRWSVKNLMLFGGLSLTFVALLFGSNLLGRWSERATIGRVKLTPSGEFALSDTELATLQWAMGKDGQLARNLYDWNKDWLSDCEKAIANTSYASEIRLIQGERQAKRGYCLLWVRPYNQRF